MKNLIFVGLLCCLFLIGISVHAGFQSDSASFGTATASTSFDTTGNSKGSNAFTGAHWLIGTNAHFHLFDENGDKLDWSTNYFILTFTNSAAIGKSFILTFSNDIFQWDGNNIGLRSDTNGFVTASVTNGLAGLSAVIGTLGGGTNGFWKFSQNLNGTSNGIFVITNLPLGVAIGGTNGLTASWMLGVDANGNLTTNAVPSGGVGSGNAVTNNSNPQNFSGVQILTNAGNTISGNGGGLTNQQATNIVGWPSITIYKNYLTGTIGTTTNIPDWTSIQSQTVSGNWNVSLTNGYVINNTSGHYLCSGFSDINTAASVAAMWWSSNGVTVGIAGSHTGAVGPPGSAREIIIFPQVFYLPAGTTNGIMQGTSASDQYGGLTMLWIGP